MESAEKEVPGTSVRLGTPAIMGGKTALQSSGLSGRGMQISSPYVLPLDSSIFYRLLLLARAIKFVFCDSTVAVLFCSHQAIFSKIVGFFNII